MEWIHIIPTEENAMRGASKMDLDSMIGLEWPRLKPIKSNTKLCFPSVSRRRLSIRDGPLAIASWASKRHWRKADHYRNEFDGQILFIDYFINILNNIASWWTLNINLFLIYIQKLKTIKPWYKIDLLIPI